VTVAKFAGYDLNGNPVYEGAVFPNPPVADAKDDGGKARLSLIPRNALVLASQAFDYGDRKYSPLSYRNKRSGEGPNAYALRYVDAAMRHLSSLAEGLKRNLVDCEHQDLTDPDSGLNHAAGAIASVAILIDGMVRDGLVEL
jgi:hypothetical protein